MDGILRVIPNDIVVVLADWLDMDDLCYIYAAGDLVVWHRFASSTSRCRTGLIDSLSLPLYDLLKSTGMKEIDYVDLKGRDGPLFITPSDIIQFSPHLTSISLEAFDVIFKFKEASSTLLSTTGILFPNVTRLNLRDTKCGTSSSRLPLITKDYCFWPPSLTRLTFAVIPWSNSWLLSALPCSLTDLHVEGSVDFAENVLPGALVRLNINSSNYTQLGTLCDFKIADLLFNDESLGTIAHIETNLSFHYFNIIKMPELKSLNCQYLSIIPVAVARDRIVSKLETLVTRFGSNGDVDSDNIVADTLPFSVTTFACPSSLESILRLPPDFNGSVICSDEFSLNQFVPGTSIIPPISSLWITNLESHRTLFSMMPPSLASLSIYEYDDVDLQFIPTSVTDLQLTRLSLNHRFTHFPHTVQSLYLKHPEELYDLVIPNTVTKLRFNPGLSVRPKYLAQIPASIINLRLTVDMTRSIFLLQHWPPNLQVLDCTIYSTFDHRQLRWFLKALPISLTRLTVSFDNHNIQLRKAWISHLVNLVLLDSTSNNIELEE